MWYNPPAFRIGRLLRTTQSFPFQAGRNKGERVIQSIRFEGRPYTSPARYSSFEEGRNLVFFITIQMNVELQHVSHRNGPSCESCPLFSKYCLSLDSYRTPESLINFSLDSILILTGAKLGSFFIWDEKEKALVLLAARGGGKERILGTRVKLKEGVAGRVAAGGRSVLVKDIHSDSRFVKMERKGEYRSYSFLSIPLLSAGKLIGIVNITEKANGTPFTEDDLRCAEFFGDHIAVAVERLRQDSETDPNEANLSRAVCKLRGNLEKQEMLETIGKFAAQLAHELNNPLDAVRRYVNLAMGEAAESSPAYEYLLNAKKGIRQSVRMIRSLLELAKENARLKVQRVNLHELIEEVIEEIRQLGGFAEISIETQFSPEPIVIEEYGLEIVLQNLIQNALHAIGGQGSVKIRTRRVDREVHISVRDTGCGIPDEIKPRIFEAFFTTKPKEEGTGLGLVISREVVERCGGKLTFESKAGEGTEFVIVLPSIEGNGSVS